MKHCLACTSFIDKGHFCTFCKEVRIGGITGREQYLKQSKREQNKRYYAANRENILQHVKHYTEHNKEDINTYQKHYYQTNKQTIQQYRNAWKRNKRLADRASTVDNQ